MMASCKSRVPAVGVYFVLPARIASAAARLMLSGVSKSGSPAPKSTTFAPVARKASAACIAARVADGFILETFFETGKGELAVCVIIDCRSSRGRSIACVVSGSGLTLLDFLFHPSLHERRH